jgi:hypothetical protein
MTRRWADYSDDEPLPILVFLPRPKFYLTSPRPILSNYHIAKFLRGIKN